MDFATLWGAVPMPEIIGCGGTLLLCVFGGPYILGIMG